MAAIHKRKAVKNQHENNQNKLSVTNETGVESKENEDVEQKENIGSKVFGYMKLTVQLLVLLTLAPALVNFAALLREEKELKPEGIMIDVRDGQKLLKTCVGKGSPTVILDAPLGETSDVWSAVVPLIAKTTKVCTYDRAGLGYSNRVLLGKNNTVKSGKPHTVERMFEDFHKLFDNEAKPYILVGADLGATVIKFYTQMLRDSVESLVLINPIFDGLFTGKDNPWEKFWFYSILPSLQMKHICSAAGLSRIGLQTGFVKEPYNYKHVPNQVKLRQKHLLCSPGHISTVVEEHYFLNVTLSQIRTLNKLRPLANDIPITLILTDRYSEDISADRNQLWLKSQDLSTKMFANGNVEVVRMKGTALEVLFNKSKAIEKLIIKSIKQWKQKSKIKSKY